MHMIYPLFAHVSYCYLFEVCVEIPSIVSRLIYMVAITDISGQVTLGQ